MGFFSVNISVTFAAALLPAFILMRYIYKKDSIEHEPIGLLVKLAIGGIAAALVSILLEIFGDGILSDFISEADSNFEVVSSFIVVAVVEEGTKLFFLKKGTWKNKNFDYRFDAIVYAAFVSLGFAGFENLLYVFDEGLSIAPVRAILSVPGHLGFSVIMGFFYGGAKLCENNGNKIGRKRNMRAAYIVPVLLHGFYDACLSAGNVSSLILFVIFVIVMYIVIIKLINKESREDVKIENESTDVMSGMDINIYKDEKFNIGQETDVNDVSKIDDGIK